MTTNRKPRIKVNSLMRTLFSKLADMSKSLLKNKHLKDFLHESAIHGLRVLLYYTPFKYARLLWLAFMFCLIIWIHATIVTLSINYIRKPTEVHMSTNLLHVSTTQFPSVAICSANKLNRSKVLSFAEEVFQKQQIYKPYYVAQTAEEMAQHLLLLKNFYVFAYDNEPLNTTLIDGLDEIFTFMFNTTNYPIRRYLRYLAPDCNNLVVAAMVYNRHINISEYFLKRMSSSSVCCIFNYNRKKFEVGVDGRYVENSLENKAKDIKFESGSLLNSVKFALKNNLEEFTVSEFQTTAFQLYIFPPDNYPPLQSNHLGEVLIDSNSFVELPIEPHFFSSSNKVRQFPPNVRNCYFDDEGKKLLNQSFYSMDECLLLCRMDSMLEHCGCVAPPMKATTKNFAQCNFANLPCLRNWKYIWHNWHENVDEQDGNYYTSNGRCPQCLPSCNGFEYFIEVNVKEMYSNYGPLYRYGLLKDHYASKSLSVVKLFFKQNFILSTEMDVVGDWVVLLNSFGGIMSLVYGFSIVSYIEMLYYATGKFFTPYFKNWISKLEQKVKNFKRTSKHNKNTSEEQEDPPPTYSLYWKELQPQRLVSLEVYKHRLQTNLYNRHEV